MNQGTSVFLDLLRVIAAVGVVLVHTGTTGFSPVFALDPAVGHHCVVVFFVLSGYVIAHATFSRPQAASAYAIARLSRLYSVLAPALLVTAVLLLAGRAINPGFYATFSRGNEPVRFGLSFFFFNESWGLSAAPPTNSPLWSLAYEFWYYALFGAWVFAPSRLIAAGLSVVLAAVAGPKILLLLPVWLLGVACHRLGQRQRLNTAGATAGLLVTGGLIALWLHAGRDFPGRVGFAPHFFSNAFVSDFALGVLVALLIFHFQQASARWRFPRWTEVPIRGGANMTFSLYLLHYPILVFLAAAGFYERTNRGQVLALLLALTAAVALLSRATEARRKPLAGWLSRQWQRVSPTSAPSATPR